MRARMNFYFSEALRSLSTNKATSLAAVIAMLVALLIVGFTAVAFLKAQAEGERIQQDASLVKVFLKETATDEQVNALSATRSSELERREGPVRLQGAGAHAREEDLRGRARRDREHPGQPVPGLARGDARRSEGDGRRRRSRSRASPASTRSSTGDENARKAINVIRWGTGVFFAIGLGILARSHRARRATRSACRSTAGDARSRS